MPHATSVASEERRRLIESAYKKLSLTPMNGEAWVFDRRSRAVLGPFMSLGPAEEMANQLNRYVQRNARDEGLPFVSCLRNGIIP